jgi:hypothetical protein
MHIYTCDGRDNQKFNLVDGKIVNTATGKCLDADTGKGYPAAGTPLQLYQCCTDCGRNGDQQKFELKGDTLVNTPSGLCVDADSHSAPNSWLQLYTCTGGDTQKFSIQNSALVAMPPAQVEKTVSDFEDKLAADVDSKVALKGFDYGSDNVLCEEWYGTMQGGGHSQASCLSFCDADARCFYATHFADTGYCHIAVTCTHTKQTHDHPITYHKTAALELPPTQVEKTVSALANVSSVPSCGGLCADGGHGTTGFISGTAPACGGTCADCGDGHCYQVEKGSVSDYGHGCWSGHKVCCCSKEMQASSQTVV